MNSDLEALIKAFDAVMEAGRQNIGNRRALFETQLEDVAERREFSKETLRAMVVLAHRKWVNAQRRLPTIPPNA